VRVRLGNVARGQAEAEWRGSGGRRKIKYARLLIEALASLAFPRALDGVLVHVEQRHIA
jgi:hypothetical protein